MRLSVKKEKGRKIIYPDIEEYLESDALDINSKEYWYEEPVRVSPSPRNSL